MAKSETKWFCDICNEKYNTKEEAEKCENGHYKYRGTVSNSYKKGMKCPQFIVCDIEIDTGDIKQVTYVAAQEGWGGK